MLARELADFTGPKTLVLGLARGGLPVAFEIAAAHRLALDVIIVRKLGVPGNEELAMGAVAPGGVMMINEDVVRSRNISDEQIAAAGAQANKEIQRRERTYRGNCAEFNISGRDVVMVDDGLATGASMAVAVEAVKARKPDRIIVAVPTGAPEACRRLEQKIDELICILQPQPFNCVGLWYEDFSQVSDDQVKNLLEIAGRKRNDEECAILEDWSRHPEAFSKGQQ